MHLLILVPLYTLAWAAICFKTSSTFWHKRYPVVKPR